MKSFEQLAEAAYEAACAHSDQNHRSNPAWASFDELDRECRDGWIAIVRRLWDEFTSLH